MVNQHNSVANFMSAMQGGFRQQMAPKLKKKRIEESITVPDIPTLVPEGPVINQPQPSINQPQPSIPAQTEFGANQIPTLDRYMDLMGGGSDWQPTQADVERAAQEQARLDRNLRDAMTRQQGAEDYMASRTPTTQRYTMDDGTQVDLEVDMNRGLRALGQGMMKLPLSIVGSGAKLNESVNRNNAINADISSLVNGDYSFTPETTTQRYLMDDGTPIDIVLRDSEKVNKNASALERIAQYEGLDRLKPGQVEDLRNIYYSMEEYMSTNPAPTEQELLNFQRLQDLMYDKDASFRARENSEYFKGREEEAERQNRLLFGAGNMATQIAAYAAAGALGEATGLTGAITSGVGKLAGQGEIAKLVAGKVANLGVNQLADLAVQDIPRLAADLTSGMDVSQAFKNFGRHELENAAWNVGIDAAGSGIGLIRSLMTNPVLDAATDYLKTVDSTGDMVTNALKQAADQTNPAIREALQTDASQVLDAARQQEIDEDLDILFNRRMRNDKDWDDLVEAMDAVQRKYAGDEAANTYYLEQAGKRADELNNAYMARINAVDNAADVSQYNIAEGTTQEQIEVVSSDFRQYAKAISDKQAKLDDGMFAEEFRVLNERLENYKRVLLEGGSDEAVRRARMDANNALATVNRRLKKAGESQIMVPKGVRSRYNNFDRAAYDFAEAAPEPVMSAEELAAQELRNQETVSMWDDTPTYARPQEVDPAAEARAAYGNAQHNLRRTDADIMSDPYYQINKNAYPGGADMTDAEYIETMRDGWRRTVDSLDNGRVAAARRNDGTKVLRATPDQVERMTAQSVSEQALKSMPEDAYAAIAQNADNISKMSDEQIRNLADFDSLKAYYEGDVGGALTDEDVISMIRDDAYDLVELTSENVRSAAEVVGTVRVGNNDVNVYDSVPDGWQEIRGATTAPDGYRWVSNGKSRFGGEYETALVPDEVFRAGTDNAVDTASQSISEQAFTPTTYKNGNGIEAYTEKEIADRAQSKKIVFNDGNNIRDFAKEAKTKQVGKRFYAGKVSGELADDIADSTGLSLMNYNITVRDGRVKHIFNKHGNAISEAKRGQVAITEDNFGEFIKTFDNPDSIRLVVDDSGVPVLDSEGRKVIEFKKRINGVYYTVTGVSDGKRNLDLDSFYITKKNPPKTVDGANGTPSPTAEPRLGQDPFSADNVPQLSQNVNENAIDGARLTGDNKTVPALRKQEGAVLRATDAEMAALRNGTPEDPADAFDWSDGTGTPRLSRSEDVLALEAMRDGGDNLPPVNRAIEPEQRISRVRTNTMQNAGISNERELINEYAEDVYRYATVTEAQSLDDAAERIARDYDGTLKRYTQDFTDDAAKQFGAQDADSMMLLYQDLNRQARDAMEIGDRAAANRLYAQAREVTLNMQKAATKSGQYIQALSKWTRTADGAIATGHGMVERMVQDSLAQNPQLAIEIGRIAGNIDDQLKGLQATDIWRRLEDGTISQYDRDVLKQEITNIIQNAIDGGKRAVKRITSVDISRMADDILEQQWVDVQRQLEFLETGFTDLKPETISRVEDIFMQMEQFPPNSKQRVDLEKQMYSAIANDIGHGKSFGEKLDAWRYFSMLSNPTTHIRNMTGNLLFGLETRVKDDIAAGIEATVDRLGRLGGGEGIQRTKSILNPLSEADNALKRGASADFTANAYRDYSGNKWYDAGRGIDSAMPTWNPNTRTGKMLNAVTEFNTRALNAEDIVAGQRKYADSMARYLKANGADASIFEATDDASMEMLENAREYALNQAKLATFHQDNKVADSFSKWVKELKGSDRAAAKVIGGALDVTIPFKRTPANILESVAAYSPLEFAKVVTETPKLLKGTVSAAQYIDDISKGLTGSIGLGIGAWLAHEGILNVNSGSQNERSFDKMTGLQDMAINVGNYSVKISELAPASVPLIEGAILFNHFLSGDKDPDNALNTIVDATTAMAESVTDMTMLQGISDALSNVRYAQSDTDIWESLGTGIASNAVSQMIPTLGGKIERVLDPYQRDTYSDKTGAAKKLEQNAKYWTQKIPGSQMIGETLQQIPVLSGIGDALAREEKVNARGETQENFGGNALGRAVYNLLSPVTITRRTETKNDREIKRLADATGNDKLYTHIASSEAKVGDYQMSPKEWSQYRKDKGRFQTELEDAFIGSDTYKELSDADRASTIDKLHTFARDYTQNQIHEKNLSKDAQRLSEAYERGGVDKVLNEIIGKSAANNAGYSVSSNAGKAIVNAVSNGNAEDIDQIKDIFENLDTIETSKTNSKKAVQEKVESGDLDGAERMVSGMQKFEDAGLKSYDYTHYQSVQQRIPSLTEDQYIAGYQKADTDGNKSLKQDEIIALMNSDPANAEMWRDVFWTNPKWKKIPVLGDDGTWRKK